jgi:hypothetical protein
MKIGQPPMAVSMEEVMLDHGIFLSPIFKPNHMHMETMMDK